MKTSSLLLLALIALPGFAAQAQPARGPAIQTPATKTPAKVIALMPANTLDIATYKIAPAPGEPALLVHLWTAPRRNPNGGGTFGAPAGFYQGKVSVEEARSHSALYLSPFVYDIFTPDGKGDWNYFNSFIISATSTPYKPELRYLNNKTKTGYIFQIGQFAGQYAHPSTIYVFTNTDPNASYFMRDVMDISPPANVGQRSSGFGRDARGYAQIIESKTDRDGATQQILSTRTISNWDAEIGGWIAGKSQ